MTGTPSLLHTHLLAHRPGSSREALQLALLRDAGEHLACIPGVRSFTVNAVVDDSHRLGIPRGRFALDAIAQIAFDREHAALQAGEHAGHARLRELLAPHAVELAPIPTEQRVFVRPPAPSGGQRDRLLKRMSILCRAPHLSAQEFQCAWRDDHGPRVATQGARLLGYVQNAVSAGCPEPPPCDGFTELWFENFEAMHEVLPESAPSSVTGNAARIIGNISTFLVREVRVF